MKSKVSLFLCMVFVLITLAACSNTSVWKNKSFDATVQSVKIQSGKVICENSDYNLVWDANTCCVELQKKGTPSSWGISPVIEGEQTVDELGMPIKKHPQLESALVIECLNPNTNLEEQFLSYNAAVKNGRIVTKEIDDGISVEYYFDEIQIMVPVNYILSDDGISVSIDPNNIQENEYKLTSVSVMPFMCSVINDSENSYLFYPSGSGALIYPETLSKEGIKYSSQVYGKDPVMKTANRVSNTKEVRIPVFGVKSQNTGICAIIDKSDESAVIETIVGSSDIKHSGVYAKFQVRGYCPNTAEFMNNVEKDLNIYSSSMIQTKMQVSYYPLLMDEADYSGMAKKYREHIFTSHNADYLKSENILNLSFIGGLKVDKSFLGIPYETILPATTITQVKDILSELSNLDDYGINSRLIGFGVNGLGNGIYAGDFKICRNLGSVKDLSNLNEYCEKCNINLFYDFDLINIKKGGSGFNTYFDVAYSALCKTAYLYDYDVTTGNPISSSKYNVLSRELLIKAADKMVSKVKDWSVNGLSLSSLSNTCYSDYSVKKTVKYYSKGNMDNDVNTIYSKVGKNYMISSEDANAYAAVMSDVIFASSTKSSAEYIFGQDIPFYQMVFKGFVSLTSESINTAVDSRTEFLKAVESGIGLNYTIINKYKDEFVNYQGYDMLSSEYGDIKASIIKDVSEYKNYFKAVKSAKITTHTVLENGLRETIFDNGVKVYTNYSSETLECPIGAVEGLNYKWSVNE